jgi:hypothetical protein
LLLDYNPDGGDCTSKIASNPKRHGGIRRAVSYGSSQFKRTASTGGSNQSKGQPEQEHDNQTKKHNKKHPARATTTRFPITKATDVEHSDVESEFHPDEEED